MAKCNPAELGAQAKSCATAENSWLHSCLILVSHDEKWLAVQLDAKKPHENVKKQMFGFQRAPVDVLTKSGRALTTRRKTLDAVQTAIHVRQQRRRRSPGNTYTDAVELFTDSRLAPLAPSSGPTLGLWQAQAKNSPRCRESPKERRLLLTREIIL